MSLSNVVKANIYLSNLSRDFVAVNEVSQQPEHHGPFLVLISFISGLERYHART